MSFKIGQYRSSDSKKIDFSEENTNDAQPVKTSIGSVSFNDWQSTTIFEANQVYIAKIGIKQTFYDAKYNIKIKGDNGEEQFIKQVTVQRSVNSTDGFPVVSFIEGEGESKINKAFALKPYKNTDTASNITKKEFYYHTNDNTNLENEGEPTNSQYPFYYVTSIDYSGNTANDIISCDNEFYKVYLDSTGVAKETQINNFSIHWVKLADNSTSEDCEVVKIVFSPNITGKLFVEKIRDSYDYMINSGDTYGVDTEITSFYYGAIKNLLGDKIAPSSLSRVAVWTHPAAIVVINYEPLMVGWNGYFEIAPTTVPIEHFALVVEDEDIDKFIVDYEYESKGGSN